MKVLILTEGGKDQGLGHIVRCSSIYQAFKKFNDDVEFIINGDESVSNFLKSFNYKIYDWLNNPLVIEKDTIVIIDSYLAKKEFFEGISKKSSILIVLDDNNRLNYPKSIVLNGTILAEKLNYPKSDEIDYLLGSEYILLREEFLDGNIININEKIETILITMGGSDLRNLTPKILDILPKNIKKTVIIGNSYKNKDLIKSDENTTLIFNPDGKAMKDAMESADLAISASGQTLYELARLGVPTIAIGIIDNQINNIKNWEDVGFIEFVGFWDNPNLNKNILNKLKLLNDSEIRKKKQIAGISAVDGKGSLRLAKFTLNKFFKENSVFRKIKEEDCLKIYEIANDDEVRANSFNSNKIEIEEHKKWFKNILKDENVEFYVLEYKEDIIGQIRLDFDEKYPVVSISLNPKFRGLGLANLLLEKAIINIKSKKIVAYIKKNNIKSINLFKKFNFELDEEVIIKNNEALKFIKTNKN